jgi:predicted TIM-barrel fold metal-dependent hydrolase
MIVDAHTHVFRELLGRIAAGPVRARSFGRITMGEREEQMLPPLCRETAFPPEVLMAQMDWAGVDKAVLLQGPFYGDQNALVLEALRTYPDRLLGAAYFDPWAEDSRARFTPISRKAGFCAVKLELSEPTGLCGLYPEARLDAPEIAWLWDRLEDDGLVATLDLGRPGTRSYQTAAVRAIAEGHPRLRIVIPHLGQITPTVEADPELRQLWLEQIDLGRLPNVWFDCAALPAYLPGEDHPYPTIGHYLRLAIERIGPEKVMWGSDIPGLLEHATYPQLVRLAGLHTQFLTPGERALFLAGNALRVYAAACRPHSIQGDSSWTS